MNYIGSKFKLSSFLQDSIKEKLQKFKEKSLKDLIFCDLFAGTATVGKIFKTQVKQVISNDKDFLEPLKPRPPAELHAIAFPISSVTVTIVLLKLALI